MRIDPGVINNPKIEVLFHETTKNFDRLPIQCRVSSQTGPELMDTAEIRFNFWRAVTSILSQRFLQK